MNKLKLSLIWLAGLLSLAACASAPPDLVACTELDLNRAFCVTTITGKAGYVDDENLLYDEGSNQSYSWWQMRNLTVSVPYHDWKKLKVWIIEQCKATGKCDDAIASWQRTLLNMDAVVDAKAGFQSKKK